MAHTAVPSPPRPWVAEPPPDPRRPRRALPWLLLAVIGLIGVAIVVIAVSLSDRPSSTSSAGTDAAPAAQPDPEPDAAPAVPTTPPSPTASPTPPSPTASPTPTTSPTPPAAAVPATPGVRTVTAADPLRVWIAGDSMWELAGPELVTRLTDTGLVEAHLDFHYSSGLTRPDFLDWPAYAGEQLAEHRPELVIFLAGANDSQPMADGGTIHHPGTDGFAAVYAARTRELMTRLAAEGRHVVWVGLPVMRSDGFDDRMTFLTDIHEQAAAAVPGVEFVPSRGLFTDAQGHFAAQLPDASGTPVPMRGTDGIHLSTQGAQRLAEHLCDHVAETWGLS